jgi:DNA-binding transcriptional ArsR family regulator
MGDTTSFPADAESGAVVTPDARSLRGLAHPLRIRLMGLLRYEGPSTATRLAQRLGLASGATSYHLRQLAAHGFVVEDTERGVGRERWWKAAHRWTRIPTGGDDPEIDEATDGFLRGVAAFWSEQMNRAIDERATLPAPWRDASIFTDFSLRLTPEELQHLRAELRDLFARYRLHDPSSTHAEPPGSAPVTMQLQAFPQPGAVGAGEQP